MSRAPSGHPQSLRPQADASVANAPTPSAAPVAHFDLIARSPTELVAIAGDCIIVVIDRTLSANGVLAIQRGFERLQSAYGRFGYLSVVEPSRLGTMDQRARSLMAELVGKYSPDIIAAS